MTPSIISLIPPIILFIVACITGNILIAFAIGITAALIIIAHANSILMIDLFFKQTKAYFTDPNVIILFLFLICIGSIISILSIIRERIALKKRTQVKKNNFIKNKKMSEYAILLFSFLFGIDDYLSILTVGFLANQFAKKFSIAKERIGYFVHGLSGPLVILVPISSWAAEIVSQLYQAGVHSTNSTTTIIASDPLFLYIQGMSYNFYSLLTLFSVWFFIQTQVDIYNNNGAREQKTSSSDTTPETYIPVFDIAIPLSVLLIATFFGLLYTGDCFLFGGTNAILTALSKNNATFHVLLFSSFSALFALIWYELWQKNIKFFEIFTVIRAGFDLMKNAIVLVSLASIFGVFVRRDLMTGIYLANTLLIHLGTSFIPFVIFITSLLIAVATGTAWGTFALLIPIVIQMLVSIIGVDIPTTVQQIPLLLPTLGAIFSGGVCGNHISPFSETTFMTAAALGIPPLHHVKNQIFYALPAIITTGLLFLLVGVIPEISLLVSFVIGCLLCILFIFLIRHFVKKNRFLP